MLDLETFPNQTTLRRFLKGLRPASTRQVAARFEAERQALALMDHPNTAKVLDAGATDTDAPCRMEPTASQQADPKVRAMIKDSLLKLRHGFELRSGRARTGIV
jgi:hypothetical protein